MSSFSSGAIGLGYTQVRSLVVFQFCFSILWASDRPTPIISQHDGRHFPWYHISYLVHLYIMYAGPTCYWTWWKFIGIYLRRTLEPVVALRLTRAKPVCLLATDPWTNSTISRSVGRSMYTKYRHRYHIPLVYYMVKTRNTLIWTSINNSRQIHVDTGHVDTGRHFIITRQAGIRHCRWKWVSESAWYHHYPCNTWQRFPLVENIRHRHDCYYRTTKCGFYPGVAFQPKKQ